MFRASKRWMIAFFLLFSTVLTSFQYAVAGPQKLTLHIADGTEDVVEKLESGSMVLNYKTLYPAANYLVGYRFEGVSIPQAAIIQSAVLKQYCSGYETQPTDFVYYGDASGSWFPFTKNNHDLTARLGTASYVREIDPLWTKNSFNQSPDLKSIVQELVSSTAWSEGGALTILMKSLNSRRIDHHESNEDRGALLEIVYDTGSQPIIPDSTPPNVQIESPVSPFETEGASMDLRGSASDDSSIIGVSWESDRGESGEALGTVQWSITGASLHEGLNTIVIRAYDAAGNAGEASVMVRYVPYQASPVFKGFGAGTVGGMAGSVYTVDSASQFSLVLSKIRASGGNATVNLKGDWTYTGDVSLAHLSNLTLNGLGASVTIDGGSFYLIDCDNVILQGLRIRKHQSGDDSLQINSCRNVIVDHCSFSEAGDGNLDITGWSYGASRNITVSWCILANTWKQSLVKYNGTTDITFHHNLLYNGGGRIIHFTEGLFDFTNNVIWQWGSYATTLSEGARVNIVNNYYKPAPSSTRQHTAIWYMDSVSSAWISGNVLPSKETDVSRVSAPYSVPSVDAESADDARISVLEGAGAFPRDAYDLEAIHMVQGDLFPPLPPYHD